MTFSNRYTACEDQLIPTWEAFKDSKHKKMFLLGMLVIATTLNDQTMLELWIPKCSGILDEEAIEEALLQTLLFAGFPKTIEALKTLRNHFPVGHGPKHVGDHRQAGEKTSRIIYGKHHSKLIQVMDELHPDLTRWMIEDGYGRVLSRSGLSLQEREISVLASLMASGMINQFRAHIRGAFNAGVPKVDIIWFTNTFACIIAADLRDDFNRVAQEMLKP
jgi:4-carboxymuconolactone decarboxylase